MAYIKLEDLQKFPVRRNNYDKANGNESLIDGAETVLEYAENLPTADVVEVVRCKDCKYSNEDGTICRYSVGRAVDPEHFCSYGKRSDT